MKRLNLEQMASLQGGDSCEVAEDIMLISCAVASVTGLIGALIAGPTCLASAIAIAVEC